MKEITNDYINKRIGMIFQEYRLKNNMTQQKFAEKLSKTAKTISRIETGMDGTSKKTDIDFMNLLEITPNDLYKQFITNPNVKRKIEINEKINQLEPSKVKELFKIIEALKDSNWRLTT